VLRKLRRELNIRLWALVYQSLGGMASFFGNKPIPTRFNWQENKQRTEWLSGMISTHGQASRVSLAYKAASLWRPWTWSKEPPQDFFCKAIPCSGKEGKYAHREYNILRKLRHEHVVRYEDFGFESPDRSPVVFLYMEYCECGDLSRYVPSPRRAHEKLTAKQARQIIQQISSALVYVHHGLLAPLGLGPETVLEDVASTRWSESQTSTAHRDIKPGNSKRRISFVSSAR
jgi:serine/threonine protein kinase